jgi:tRNA (guanine37-N1)-methyltransferase
MLRFDIITLFPTMFSPVFRESIVKRAQEKKKMAIYVHDLRDYTHDAYHQVDDRPFGGGPGMVMMPEPIFSAVKKIKGRRKTHVILTCAGGKRFTQAKAKELAKLKNILVIAGHYEGVDERVREHLVDESLSVGDYVLTGGELPAMVIVDAVTRLLPGVLGKAESLHAESFENNLLEYPQYTRPADFQGMKVPAVLLSGHHREIEKWRQKEAIKRTGDVRPDLIFRSGPKL